MQIQEALSFFNNELKESDSKLIAISKTYSSDVIFEAYKYGQLAFGENKVQEMVS